MKRSALWILAGAFLVAGAGSALSRPTNRNAPVMVSVPLVTQTDLPWAYAKLHQAGLRVAIRGSFSMRALCMPIARDQRPYPDALVLEGTAVSIRAGFCPLGSPAVVKTSARVPDFVGRSLSRVVHWADRRNLSWEARRLPSLPASNRAHLLDNYRVTRQMPRPGTTLRPGMLRLRPGGGSFRPTPIVVAATLARR